MAVPTEVRSGRGNSTASITELGPTSAFLSGSTRLQFRDQITFELAGRTVQAEVVHVSDAGVGVVFAASPQLVLLWQREAGATTIDLEGDGAVMPMSTLDLPPVRQTEPSAVKVAPLFELGDDATLKVRDPLSILALLSTLHCGRAVVARGASSDRTRAELWVNDTRIDLVAQGVGNDLYALTAEDPDAVRDLLAKQPDLKSVLAAPAAPDVYELPALEPDGRVRFLSRAQYDEEYRKNLANGALILRADPVPIGARRQLRLVVPGVDGEVETAAKVAFVGKGTLGFMIEDMEQLKARLGEASPRTSVPSAAPTEAQRPPPRRDDLNLDAPLGRAVELPEVLEFRASPPDTLAACRGWPLKVIDFVLRSRRDAVVSVDGAGDRISLWLHDGRMVYTERDPEKSEDLVGTRLVADSRLSRVGLKDAVEQSRQHGQPIGVVLVNQGRVSSEELNRALRAQMIARVVAADSMSTGRITVKPWRDPQPEARLLPVSGNSICAEVLRHRIRSSPVESLKEAIARAGRSRLVVVDRDRIDPTFRLTGKELRFFQRVADAHATFEELPTITAVLPAEAARICGLGMALELVQFGSSSRQSAGSAGREHDLVLRYREQCAAAARGAVFEVLGVHWTASQDEIRRAHQALAQLIARHVGAHGPSELGRVAAELRDRAEAAFRTLSTREGRIAERRRAADLTERRSASQHLVAQAESALFREERAEAETILAIAEEIEESQATVRLRARLRA